MDGEILIPAIRVVNGANIPITLSLVDLLKLITPSKIKDQVIKLEDSDSPPNVPPENGIIIYSENGNGKCMSSDGTIGTLAPSNKSCMNFELKQLSTAETKKNGIKE